MSFKLIEAFSHFIKKLASSKIKKYSDCIWACCEAFAHLRPYKNISSRILFTKNIDFKAAHAL